MKEVKIEFPSILDNIRIVESFIDQHRENYHITDDLYGNILIALTEAVNNAIHHGNQNNKDKLVRLTCQPGNTELSFTVTDQGSGFDYTGLPDPTSEENLLKTDGRGVFLMKQLSDVLRFEDNGRRVEMVFYL